MAVPFKSPLVYFGKGSLKNLRYIRGKKALIITDKTMREIGILEKVQKQLSKSKSPMTVEVFDEIEPNPLDTTVLKGVEAARKFEPDWIIGLGGGSPMDAAKVIYAMYEKPDLELKDISPLKRFQFRQKAQLLTIATTSGTGAEVTWGAVITSAEKGIKLSLGCVDIVADVAIVDAKLASSMPRALTIATGLDALTHAIEGYVTSLKNDFADGMCLHGTKMTFEWLPRVCADLNDDKARIKMHHAATIAGLGFGNSQAGLAHGIGHTIGALYHIPHGNAVGMLLPLVIEFNESVVDNLYQDINRYCGFSGQGSASEILANEVRTLMRSIEAPMSLQDMKVSQDTFNSLLDRAVHVSGNDPSTSTNPRQPTPENLRTLLNCIFTGTKYTE